MIPVGRWLALGLTFIGSPALANPHVLSLPYPSRDQVEWNQNATPYRQLVGAGQDPYSATAICAAAGVPATQQSASLGGKTILTDGEVFYLVHRDAALTHPSLATTVPRRNVRLINKCMLGKDKNN